jgi:hypothetical protein
LADEGATLADDSRTVVLVDKKGFRVIVNPCYGTDKERIVNPPLLMGIHFLNDFNKIYDEHTKESLKDKVAKHNNVWVDDQGAVRVTRRICVGDELFLSYEGKSQIHRYQKVKKGAKGSAGGNVGGTGARRATAGTGSGSGGGSTTDATSSLAMSTGKMTTAAESAAESAAETAAEATAEATAEAKKKKKKKSRKRKTRIFLSRDIGGRHDWRRLDVGAATVGKQSK